MNPPEKRKAADDDFDDHSAPTPPPPSTSTPTTTKGIFSDTPSYTSATGDGRGYPRKRVALACEVCRLRKTRCDAERPSCSFCKKLEIECVYRGPSKGDRQRNDGEDTATASRLEKIESTLETIAFILEQPQQPPLQAQYEHQNRPSHGSRASHKTTTMCDQPMPMSHHSEYSMTSPASAVSASVSRQQQQHQSQPMIPRMPNLFTFSGPDPWFYDSTEDFFSNQLDGMTDLRHMILAVPVVELSRPHLWRLQQSFVENVLKWLPLFDHETCLKHLQAAQACKYAVDSPSLCLVFLVNAIGSLALDSDLYHESFHALPGASYYVRAFEMMKNFPPFGKDLCILQCRTLEAMYFLYAMRPLEAWKALSQASQNCILLLKAGTLDHELPAYRDAFERIYWICYIIDSELEICLELPSSGLKSYEMTVSLPGSHYEEDGMYYLLALTSLRKLMVEVISSTSITSSASAAYAPVVVIELRKQIDDWLHHLPSSLQFPLDHSLLFDKRRAYLRCQYHALIAVVFWPFVARSNLHDGGDGGEKGLSDEESERIQRGSDECLMACRNLVRGTDEILLQKTIDSHVIVRSYFALTTILLLIFEGTDSEPSINPFAESREDQLLLEYALENLSHWNVVPFFRKPMEHLERMARLKGLTVPS